MTVVVVGNEKGGCGKTTIAVNLAAMAAATGRKTLLIDADPGQQSAARWWARREEHSHVAKLALETLQMRELHTLPDLCSHYQFVAIDTGAMDSPHLRASMLSANLIVIPVQPDELDLWTLPTMERLFAMARMENDVLQALVVLNRTPYQTAPRLIADAKGWIASCAPGLQDAQMVSLIGRAAYGRASGSGLAVTEPRPRDTKAASEIEKLFSEVLKHGSKHEQV